MKVITQDKYAHLEVEVEESTVCIYQKKDSIVIDKNAAKELIDILTLFLSGTADNE
ncbi:hypothetical protein [Acinetobacter phage HFM1]|nr:hypothetical protein [Acinetobacter phage HFM1]